MCDLLDDYQENKTLVLEWIAKVFTEIDNKKV